MFLPWFACLLAFPIGQEARTTEVGPATAPIHDDEWYLETSDRRCRLFVREYGTGAPVVVLHGGWGAEHSYLLDAIWPHRDRARFVLYDQRGSLRSPAAPESISVARHVTDLEELRAELGLERMTLFAHSMGTFLAMANFEAHPEHVEALILTGALPARHVADGPPFADWNQRAAAMSGRPEVDDLLREEGLLGGHLDDRQNTHAWRIRFAATNLADLRHWRAFRGGNVFYSSEAGQAAVTSMPEQWDFAALFDEESPRITVLQGDQDYVEPGAASWQEMTGEPPAPRGPRPSAGRTCGLVRPTRALRRGARGRPALARPIHQTSAATPRLPASAALFSLRVLEVHVLPQAGHAAWYDQPVRFAEGLAGALP